MSLLLARIGLIIIVAAAAFLVGPVKRAYHVSGYGRDIQPITDFPYKCRRLYEPLATNERPHAAEDMWLSEATRQLFLAASDQHARKQWFPNMGHLNLTGRSEIDAVIVLDIDALDPSSSKVDASSYRVLSTPRFKGTAGDGHFHIIGISGLETDEGIKLYFTNNRPSVDAVTGELLDQTVVGANATIEVFATGPKATRMKHERTYAHRHIVTPNNVAPVPDTEEGIYITNDHGQHKTGLQFTLSPWLATGDVTYCSPTTCRIVSKSHKFPNGLLRSRREGLLYVPSSAGAGVYVYRILASHDLEQVAHIDIPWSLDNLSEDANGDIYAAAFPKPIEALTVFNGPELKTYATATVLRIRKDEGAEGGYVWDKILEDRDRVVLPGATTVVHDARTGRLFLSGNVSPFITVCEPWGGIGLSAVREHEGIGVTQ
ncbi:hypothetical protein GE09DRAFT_979088 [Coniochaeta sp. 2T2.1]|nr:hypothetical protein GE09DRAFT_979088 [Coniochaeta sp. 2T2.1]